MDFIIGILLMMIIIFILINFSSISMSDSKSGNNYTSNNYLLNPINNLNNPNKTIIQPNITTPTAKSSYDYRNYFYIS